MTDLLSANVVAWIDVCHINDLLPGRGRAALIDGTQVAVFRLAADSLYALSNFDPFSQAYVLSRGIVGTKGDVVKVSSPIFKQSFDLATGECLDDPAVRVATLPVRVLDERVEVGRP